jgi:geranylgeranyl reductase family protein
MRQVDLVVMGGGPAGSSAARTAAARGLSVVLVDKATFPRDKLCGGLLSGRTAAQVRAVFGQPMQGDLFQFRQDFLFSWKNRPFTQGVSEIPLHLTMRRDFDLWLLTQAGAAGADVHQAERGADPGLDTRVLTLTSGERIGWRALIGADGVNSAVARALFGSAFDRAKIGFTLEAEIPHDQSLRGPDQPIQVDFGGIPWGYAWSFPKRRTVTLGLGALEARAGDFKARMARLMAVHVKDPATIHVKGHFIPFGDFRAVPGKGRVILAGDAAGLVDPLTGEGIAYALESGALAANAVADWLAAGEAGDLASGYAAALGRIHRSLHASNRLAATMHARFVPSALKQRMVADPRIQRKFFAILGGAAESSDVAHFNLKSYFAGG